MGRTKLHRARFGETAGRRARFRIRVSLRQQQLISLVDLRTAELQDEIVVRKQAIYFFPVCYGGGGAICSGPSPVCSAAEPYLGSSKGKIWSHQYDKFHIMQHANAAVDEVRRAEFFRKGGAAHAVVKGKRWLSLSRWVNLNTQKRRQLNALLPLNRRFTQLRKSNLYRSRR